MRRATDALAPLRSYGAVMGMALPVLAGMVSTTVFAGSVLPMLLKAARTRDLSSYSRGNLVLANVGNAVHSIYVFHLPSGPIWLLHAFHTTTSALMLFWWIRYRPRSRRPRSEKPAARSTVRSAEPRCCTTGGGDRFGPYGTKGPAGRRMLGSRCLGVGAGRVGGVRGLRP